MQSFLADESKLQETRAALEHSATLPTSQKKTLELFERTFSCYIMESEEAKRLREECTVIEGNLEQARNQMKLGASVNGEYVELSSVGLRNKLRTDPEESTRKSCWEGQLTPPPPPPPTPYLPPPPPPTT